MKIISEFKEFLKEYKILGLAIAFIMGAAATSLVKSFVNDIVMPSITPFIAGGAWKTAVLTMGPVVWSMGSFIGEAINFLVIALVIFFMVKIIVNKDSKKK